MSEAGEGGSTAMSRRKFMQTVAASGAAMTLVQPLWAQAAESGDDLNLAIIGPGSQGRNLMTQCLKVPGVRFRAVCDVWPYHQKYASNILGKFGQPVNVYADYRRMLAEEKDLDAVIIATPDWVHAEQTVACLKAGLHVYCEKEMSNTLEGAASMVRAARQTGKLLQIGHQRRSNPRYWHAMKLLEKDKVCGRVTHFYGQWNRVRRLELGWPEKYTLDKAALEACGYETMDQFRNWRWYRRYSGGPIADLGSHQIDVFNWVFGRGPVSVMANGGNEYYPRSEWYDNVMAIYEYPGDHGPVRGMYQVLNSTSYGDFYEAIMGDEGTIVVSEDTRRGAMYREVQAPKRQWEDEAEKIEQMGREAITLKIGQTLAPDGQPTAESQRLLAEAEKPVHQLHLENFFRAIRDGEALNCPGEVGYETAVSVLKVNEAIETGRRLDFQPEWFKA